VGATPALSYFVIRVNAARYGRTRDELLTFLRSHGVLAKAYFHPLTSTLPCYSDLQGASPELLPVATEVASETLSLPLYGSLGAEGAAEISRLITQHAAL
jgi:dTDP-4-amino-4,6-dideoxygalactose transaminase